jgi:hypothetical protein
MDDEVDSIRGLDWVAHAVDDVQDAQVRWQGSHCSFVGWRQGAATDVNLQSRFGPVVIV